MRPESSFVSSFAVVQLRIKANNIKLQKSIGSNFQDFGSGLWWKAAWFLTQRSTIASLPELIKQWRYKSYKVSDIEGTWGWAAWLHWVEGFYRSPKKGDLNAQNSNLLEHSSVLQIQWRVEDKYKHRSLRTGIKLGWVSWVELRGSKFLNKGVQPESKELSNGSVRKLRWAKPGNSWFNILFLPYSRAFLISEQKLCVKPIEIFNFVEFICVSGL